jgi:hypothetical protein
MGKEHDAPGAARHREAALQCDLTCGDAHLTLASFYVTHGSCFAPWLIVQSAG